MPEINEEDLQRLRVAASKAQREQMAQVLETRRRELADRERELMVRARELSVWELQANLARTEMKERFSLAQRSQWFALVSLFAALGTTLALALTGHDNVAMTVITVTVVPVVGLYITGKYAERKDTATNGADPAMTAAQKG